MSKLIKANETKEILNTKVGQYKIGSLYTIEMGCVYLQAFKKGHEGILTYGILDTGYIDLANPIGFNDGAFLSFNHDTNSCETKYY